MDPGKRSLNGLGESNRDYRILIQFHLGSVALPNLKILIRRGLELIVEQFLREVAEAKN